MFIAKQINYEFDAEGIALRKLGKTLNFYTRQLFLRRQRAALRGLNDIA